FSMCTLALVVLPVFHRAVSDGLSHDKTLFARPDRRALRRDTKRSSCPAIRRIGVRVVVRFSPRASRLSQRPCDVAPRGRYGFASRIMPNDVAVRPLLSRGAVLPRRICTGRDSKRGARRTARRRTPYLVRTRCTTNAGAPNGIFEGAFGSRVK